jgi:hypothetical protein
MPRSTFIKALRDTGLASMTRAAQLLIPESAALMTRPSIRASRKGFASEDQGRQQHQTETQGAWSVIQRLMKACLYRKACPKA